MIRSSLMNAQQSVHLKTMDYKINGSRNAILTVRRIASINL